MVLIISFLMTLLFSGAAEGVRTTCIELPPLPDHSVWSAELKKYVSDDGKVNYKAWANDQDALDVYLSQLAGTQPLSNWSTNVQLAYWINVYNAYTIKLVLQHYPVQSIKDIHQGNPWDLDWIKLDGKTYSLSQIENEYIHQRFRDPRIHFALNCAARSCPPLLNEAYDPAKLDAQLTSRTKSFITDQHHNQITTLPIHLSQLFVWYKDDFKPDVISFLNTYLTTPISNDAGIEYVEHDWSLNSEK